MFFNFLFGDGVTNNSWRLTTSLPLVLFLSSEKSHLEFSGLVELVS